MILVSIVGRVDNTKSYFDIKLNHTYFVDLEVIKFLTTAFDQISAHTPISSLRKLDEVLNFY